MLQKYMLSPLIVCSSEVTMSTKVSFGVSLPQQRVDFDTVKEVALICEKLGYDSIWCYDHFFPMMVRIDNNPSLNVFQHCPLFL
jgi:Luciferase-like monooxygenase.